jgi:hypothetical protein
VCNGGLDDDCDGATDDDDGAIGGNPYYADGDGDGYGGGEPTFACVMPTGLMTDGSDCDDLDPEVNPGAEEICNGIDDDCDPFLTETGTVMAGGVVYWSIQDAVDAAAPGSTVLVCDGTFFEAIQIEKDLILRGRGASASIIDASGSASVVAVTESDVTVTVRELTLQHGTGREGHAFGGTGGGGIDAWSAETLAVVSTVVTGCAADYGGAILGPAQGDLWISSSVVSDSSAAMAGGGVYAATGEDRTVDIHDSEISGNTTDGDGGGIQIALKARDPGTATIADTVVDANVAGDASHEGGGISNASVLTLTGVTVSNNTAGRGEESGPKSRSPPTTTPRSSQRHVRGRRGWRNRVRRGGLDGGHVWGNAATTGGGAAVLGGYSASTAAHLSDVLVDGNEATTGGGLWVDSRAALENSEVTANTATQGAGLFVTTDRAEPHNCASLAESDPPREHRHGLRRWRSRRRLLLRVREHGLGRRRVGQRPRRRRVRLLGWDRPGDLRRAERRHRFRLRRGGGNMRVTILAALAACAEPVDSAPTQQCGLAFFADADGDGHGDTVRWTTACDAPVGYVELAGDCDDGDRTSIPVRRKPATIATTTATRRRTRTRPMREPHSSIATGTDSETTTWSSCDVCRPSDS